MTWREAYPWIANPMLPIIIFWTLKNGVDRIDWLVPIFVITTIFTLGTGPPQAHGQLGNHGVGDGDT